MSHHVPPTPSPSPSPSRRLGAGLSSLAFLITLAGCTDDFGTLLSPEEEQVKERVSEGARLTGTLSSQITLMPAAGGSSATMVAPERFAASFRGGAAVPEFARGPGVQNSRPSHADLRGLRIAVDDEGGAPQKKRVIAHDEAGRTHEIVLETVGKRLIGSRHFIDGELFASVDQSWGRERAFWILKDLTTTAGWEGNGGSLRTTVNANALWSAAIREGIEGIPGGSTGTAFKIMPEYESCLSATLELVAASGALAIALTGGQVWMVGVGMFAYSSAVLDYWGACY